VDRVEEPRAVVSERLSLPEMAPRFVLANTAVATVIVGMRQPEHVAAYANSPNLGPLDSALLAEWRRRGDRPAQ
jgi:aryl-alcohol dehydrogenase-like predicted oxidoreductase